MKPVQILLLGFVLFAALKVVRTYQGRGMRTPAFAAWTSIWLGTGLIIVFPGVTSLLAQILGIGRGADLIVYAGLLIVFYLIWRIHLTLDRLDAAITEIVRTIALEQLTASQPLAPASAPSPHEGQS